MNKTYIHIASFIFILLTTIALLVVPHFYTSDTFSPILADLALSSILFVSIAWFYFNYPAKRKDRIIKKRLVDKNYTLSRLNAELEKTKSILEATNLVAKVGGWEFDLIKNELTWTKVTKFIHELPEDYEPEITTAINYYKEGFHRDKIKLLLENMIKTGEPYSVEGILITAKGNERWVRAHGNAEMKDGVCVRLFGTLQDIHENKIQAMQLEDKEQKYRLLFENNNVPFILFDENSIAINANEAALSLFGYTKEEFHSLHKNQLFTDFEQKKEELYAKRRKYGFAIMDFKGVKKDATLFESEVYSSSFINSEGKTNVLKIVKDTTALNEANYTIKKNEETFSKLLEKVEIGIYEFQMDAEGQMKLNFVSKGFQRIFNDLTNDEMLNNFQLLIQKVHPEEVDSIIESIKESFINLTDWNVTYRIIQNGELKWIKGSSKPERLDDGRTIWYGYLQDITNIVHLENKIVENQKALLNLTQKIDICLFEFISKPNGSMHFNFISQAFENIFTDITIEELKKDAILLVSKVHPEDKKELLTSIYKAIQTQTTWIHENRIINNNETIWVKGEANPERKPDGSIYWYGYIENITKKKEEYTQLKLLESVVIHSKDMIVIAEAMPVDSKDGPKIIYVNEAFEKITGYSKEEVLNKTPRILQGPNTKRERLNHLKEAMQKWEIHTTEVINYKKNGEEFWNNFTVIPIADAKGIYTHWVSIEIDVTQERKNILDLEERNERLEEIAFKQSHIVRAPLARIMGLIDFLEKNPSEYNQELVGYILYSARELDDIIRDIVNDIHQGKQ